MKAITYITGLKYIAFFNELTKGGLALLVLSKQTTVIQLCISKVGTYILTRSNHMLSTAHTKP